MIFATRDPRCVARSMKSNNATPRFPNCCFARLSGSPHASYVFVLVSQSARLTWLRISDRWADPERDYRLDLMTGRFYTLTDYRTEIPIPAKRNEKASHILASFM